MTANKCVLALDIGGTSVKLGLVERSGALTKRAEVAFTAPGAMLAESLAAARAFAEGGLIGVGVSATGQIDVNAGVVAGTCGNLPGWDGADVAGAFSREFHLPVTVMNDANAALLGECWMGKAQGYDDVILVTLGTGVGGGILSGGRLIAGSRGLAGELGHMPVYAGGRSCTCGQRGCLEQYASVTALRRLAKDICPGEVLTGREVFDRAASGDAPMKDVIDRWIRDMAPGLAGLVHLLNPALLLIGGGVSAQRHLLIDPLKTAVAERIMPRYREGLAIKAASLKNAAGLLGAAKHLIDTLT